MVIERKVFRLLFYIGINKIYVCFVRNSNGVTQVLYSRWYNVLYLLYIHIYIYRTSSDIGKNRRKKKKKTVWDLEVQNKWLSIALFVRLAICTKWPGYEQMCTGVRTVLDKYFIFFALLFSTRLVFSDEKLCKRREHELVRWRILLC